LTSSVVTRRHLLKGSWAKKEETQNPLKKTIGTEERKEKTRLRGSRRDGHRDSCGKNGVIAGRERPQIKWGKTLH